MSSSSSFTGGIDHIDPFDPGDFNLWRKAEYLGRYLFAVDFLSQHHPDTVADISCGMGYGTFELCRIAKTVIGIDSSQELIEKASDRVGNQNASSHNASNHNASIRFLNKNLDCEDLSSDIEDGSIDAVVSFETLEHLVDPNGAVSQFSRILRPDGFLICSVPNVLYESGDSAGLPRNKSHKQWFRFGSLCRMVEGQGMRVAYRLGQSWSKTLHRREQQLSNAKRIGRKLSDEPAMHSPEMIRWLSYVAAYPTVEDVDGSYSIIIVAQKDKD